jgi:2-polyprenyl-3-methyl-5-hydroxy-6-metoxy-1,4-benzoquinol methylase
MIPDRSAFKAIYAGQAPWDIGKPQKPFIDVADRITGSVLDAGCGTGDTALFLAERGCKVTGIDFLGRSVVSDVLQRSGAGRAGAEASVEERTALRLCRGLEHRVR